MYSQVDVSSSRRHSHFPGWKVCFSMGNDCVLSNDITAK